MITETTLIVTCFITAFVCFGIGLFVGMRIIKICDKSVDNMFCFEEQRFDESATKEDEEESNRENAELARKLWKHYYGGLK